MNSEILIYQNPDGKNYPTNHYNLDVIISVGYRVKSVKGTQFHLWATHRLKEYIIKGFTLNELQNRIREIRLSEKRLFPTKKGTPQGGSISPLIMKKFPRWKRQKVNFIRYADDFVITAIDKETIIKDIIPMVKEFLAERGKEAVQSFKDKLKKLFRKHRGIPAHALIRILNPVIRGWSNYHKGICSKDTFGKLEHFIYWQLKRWAKHQHGNKNRRWIYHRYFHDNHVTDKRITKKGIEINRLFRIGYVPIQYHVKVKAKANPFLYEYDNYFDRRTKLREELVIECKQITTFMINK